jgi:VWFA-related protein
MKVPSLRVATLLLVGAAVVQSQEPQQPVFRGRLVTVAVPVTVFDRYDTLVTSLTREDFAVFDNGRRQEITTFSSGLQPIRAVVLVDTSASMMPAIDLARAAAEQFVIRLRPGDQAKVGFFNVRVELSPRFTADRDGLLAWLRRDLSFSNPTRLLDAINQSVTELLPESGRRVVIVFTDGCDTASDTGWSTLANRINAEDVMVYAVMFQPRIILKPPPQQVMNFGSARSGYAGGRSDNRPLPCMLHHHLELRRDAKPSDFLKVDDPRWIRGPQLVHQLAADTGGGRLQLTPAAELNTIFTAVMNELHYLYLLGFTAQTLDGKMHDLTVKVKDPTLLIRAREHYLAPLPPTSAGRDAPRR